MPRTTLPALLLAILCTSLHAQTPAPLVFGKGSVPFALLRQSWIEDLEAHRLLASLGRYAPDADFLSGDGGHAEGTAAIRQLYSFVFDHFDASIAMTSRVTSQSGDLAYDSGSYTEQITDRTTHKVTPVHGDYLTIYRHLGLQWLIVQQAFTQAPAGVNPGESTTPR